MTTTQKTREILDRLQADGRIGSWTEVPDDPDGCDECGHNVDDHDGTGPCPLDDCQSFVDLDSNPNGCPICGLDDHAGTEPCSLADLDEIDPTTPEGGRFGMDEAALEAAEDAAIERIENSDDELSETEWRAALEFGGFTANRSGWYDKGTARVIVDDGQVTVYRFDEHYVLDWQARFDVAVPQSVIDAAISAALKEGPRR